MLFRIAENVIKKYEKRLTEYYLDSRRANIGLMSFDREQRIAHQTEWGQAD